MDNMPDVWGLLSEAREVFETANWKQHIGPLLKATDAALAQRDRWQLVPKEPTMKIMRAMEAPLGLTEDGAAYAATSSERYLAALAAAPQPGKQEGKSQELPLASKCLHCDLINPEPDHLCAGVQSR
jgi:hypothetical protein